MPIILYIGMVVILLNVATVMYVENKTEYEIEKTKFDKEQHTQQLDNIKQDILTYYSNNYGMIHGDYETSNMIKELSNIEGDPNTFYLFNNERFCTYILPEVETIDDISLDDEVYVPKILNIQEVKQKVNFNTNMSCIPAKEMYNELISFTNEEKETIDQLKKAVGDDFFIRIDIETIMKMRYLNLPILNLYMYDITKRHKPDMTSEIRLNTDIVVVKKVEESKVLLNEVSNLLVEYGKRKFKGYAKLNAYNGVNAYSNLAEGFHRESDSGVDYYGLIGSHSDSGFQSTNVMAFPTHYMNENTQSIVDDLVEEWTNNDSNVKCGYTNAGFAFDSNIDWFSDNSYYMCKFPQIDNNWFSDSKIPKPIGYCALEDNCALVYKMNNKNKIVGIEKFTLNEYLKSDEGFNYDLSSKKNPFFPNQKISENFNLILSSSNGNEGSESTLGINLGLRAINRPTGLYNNDTINLFDVIDFEDNYIINKYYINF